MAMVGSLQMHLRYQHTNLLQGAFDWTTSDPSNAYTDASGLHIVPTLTTESTSITGSEIYNGYSLNLTESGTCTGTSNATCAVSSNMTLGTMIPPVRSARLSTKGKASIRYGRVEVTARMPVGDWLW
jgi:beta-glucanase (GH16 family)